MSTKASMNHYLGGQVKVCVFVPCIFFLLYYSYHSVLPETVSLEMDLRTTYVTRSLSATSLFITNFPFVASCHLRGQSGTWTLGHPAGERGKLVGWLERWVLREGSQPFQRKKWLTVSVYIAGRHEHPEVGEERGPEWQKTCQNGDNKQGHPNCVTIKTTKGQKDFWVYCCTFEP